MQDDDGDNNTKSSPLEGYSPAGSDVVAPGASVDQAISSSATSVAPGIQDVSQPVTVLPSGLLDSVGNISISGAVNQSGGGSTSGTETNLGFNVDALNLESIPGLNGLAFDLASIYSQVSGLSTAAFANSLPQSSEVPPGAITAAPAQHAGTLAETSRLSAAPFDFYAVPSPIASQPLLTQSVGYASAARPPSGEIASPIQTGAVPGIVMVSDSLPARVAHTTTPQVTGPLGMTRSAGPVKTVRPATSPVLLTTRPRPSRPLVSPQPTAPHATRPLISTDVALPTSASASAAVARPAAGPTGAPRPAPPRPGQAAGPPGARPRPATATPMPASGAMRPGARPTPRPRPLVRPAQPGVPGVPGIPVATRPPVAGRPVLRPGMRPVVRPTLSPGGTKLSPTSPQAPAVGRSGPLAASPGSRPAAPLSSVSPTAATGAIRPQRPLSPSLTTNNLSQRQATSEIPDSALARPDSETAILSPQIENVLAVESNFSAIEAVADEERYLTELVVATCPPLIAPPKGFEPLYGLEGAFRSLCHGILPSNAEWSSLNILAVTWPQLEIEPTTSRRLAQRDIPDVSSMSATDSMRPVEERRPPSSAIHLYRLHVHPPPAWDAGARLRPIQPSLLPLCDLRMQQHWDEQVSRANMDRLVDDFAFDQPDQPPLLPATVATSSWPCSTVNVSPLSGWHGGASQAGAGERMRVASAPRCAWSADCRMLAAGDRAGRFEIFHVGTELNSWHSVYHVDFDYPVIACLWLANQRKYGISRRSANEATTGDGEGPANDTQAASLSAGSKGSPHNQHTSVDGDTKASECAEDRAPDSADSLGSSNWEVDPNIFIRRLPFFGPRNTQGEYALVVLTADGQLVLIYQRDEKWVRVVSPLEPKRKDLRPDIHTSSSADDGDSMDACDDDSAANEPDVEDASAAAVDGKGSDDMSDPWSNIPKGLITHADMMLVSKKWIYVTTHRAGAAPVNYPHEPGAISEELKRDGRILAPTVEVYRIQVEFASDYSPRLFAMPLVVQPITLPLDLASSSDSAMEVDSGACGEATKDDTSIPRVTHLKLITALNPEIRLVETNVLGERHYFPLLFVSLGKMAASGRPGSETAPTHDAFTTFIQVWRLESAPHAQKSVTDLLRRPPPLKLSHMWTESRRGLLLSVIANRAERQQLRYLFAKPSDKDYRALMLTWADGKVEMLRNYQDHDDRTPNSDCFDQCVQAVPSSTECVIGSVLSPHYTAYFQLVMRPWTVELDKKKGERSPRARGERLLTPTGGVSRGEDSQDDGTKPDTAVTCAWSQSHARFRLGWTPFFSDLPSQQQQQQQQPLPAPSVARTLKNPMNAHVQAYCGDLFAVRVLNKEDSTDLIAILANMAAYEENQPLPAQRPSDKKASKEDESGAPTSADYAGKVLSVPTSRTLSQALFRACTLLTSALGVKSIELDPLSSTTPYVRRLLGAIMQIHFLAQHNIQATSLGLVLHIASVVDARVTTVHDHILHSVTSNQNMFDIVESFSDKWQQTFPSTAALVLWCIDLFVALIRDTYLYLNVRCADSDGSMKRLCELDSAVESLASREMSYLQSFRGASGTGGGIASNSDDACLLPGGLPSRLALLFHRPTLDALRSLMTFVSLLEADLFKRIQLLNYLPPNAASVPEYANMVRSKDMVVSTAQQLAHALEYLPVSMQRMKDFLSEVQDLYASDEECTSLSAQTILVSTSTVTGPFRKYLPQVARCFSQFILEPDLVNASAGKPASPSALVLYDTRWMNVVMCRSNIPGLSDDTAVFETPWCVRVPVMVADPKLIEADEDALVPTAELAEWEREKSEFERALDEDNVLFDIDDPGFIFFDTSDPLGLTSGLEAGPMADAIATDLTQLQHQGMSLQTEYSRAMSSVASRASALAPVRITTKVPDFSDVLDSCASQRGMVADVDVDYMFNTPLLFDSMHGHAINTNFGLGGGIGGHAARQTRTRSSSAAVSSPPTTSRMGETSSGYSWTLQSHGGGQSRQALAFQRRHGNVQHFVPHYSNASSMGTKCKEELSSGWQFISTPRDSKLHIPTLLAQHAYSLAALHQKRRQRQAMRDQGSEGDSGASGESDVASHDEDMSYCIDWSRSDGVVVESSAPSGISSLAATAINMADATNDADTSPMAALALGRHQKQLEYISNGSADRVDVVQKTMLSNEAPVKMCLRCGHVTRRESVSTNTHDGAAAIEAAALFGLDVGQGRRTDGRRTSVTTTSSGIGWIGRFNLNCVCGGSWIAI
ncbi:hypothetical protein GGH93_004643 [Coemansia aciculifera]|nr:hypothetical protein GGH93_004643 [Coemansia aciculifera]